MLTRELLQFDDQVEIKPLLKSSAVARGLAVCCAACPSPRSRKLSVAGLCRSSPSESVGLACQTGVYHLQDTGYNPNTVKPVTAWDAHLYGTTKHAPESLDHAAT